MPEELKSFLISVAAILALALFIPCIESVAKLIRSNARLKVRSKVAEMKPSKRYGREAA